MPYEHGKEVDQNSTVTQVGTLDPSKSGKWSRPRFRFQVRPDDNDEGYLSAYVGRLTVSEAIVRISLGQRTATSRDAIRCTKVQALVNTGFKVVHIPDTCEEHIGIYRCEGDWDDDAANGLDRCFREYLL